MTGPARRDGHGWQVSATGVRYPPGTKLSRTRLTVAAAPGSTDIAADLIARSGAQDVTLMGDSAGGNIVLGIAQTLRHRGLPQPRQLVLISPGLDVSKSNPEMASVARHDRVLGVAGSAASKRLYLGELDSKDPLVSPVYADLTGLAPMISLDYHEEPGAQHVYPLLPTAEGTAARKLIIESVASADDQLHHSRTAPEDEGMGR